MRKLISCEFNFDTVCVELKFSDGSIVNMARKAKNCSENTVASLRKNNTTLFSTSI
ncbi:MAG: hypothetical protein J6D19_00175 [Clostridia bacterium]|nr:hypothetical protein [Clostridia bacterium]